MKGIVKQLTVDAALSKSHRALRWLIRSAVHASFVAALTTVSFFFAVAAPLAEADSPRQIKLLFSGPQAITDTWGKLYSGVLPVRLIRACEDPEFTVASCFRRPDNLWEVFGQQLKAASRGQASFEETHSWKIIRATTRDGVTFENQETVLDQLTAPWTQHAAMAYNPDAEESLRLKLKMDSFGFADTAFLSADGHQWQEHPGNPRFYGGDAMSLFWSPMLHRFVCVKKSLQSYRKHIRDHGGSTKGLGDDSLRDRRARMMRSSSDGRHWEPSVSLLDVWDHHGRKGSHPPGFLTVRDAGHPPDLEFYSSNGNIFFPCGKMLMGVPEDGISFVGAHANGEFFTKSFKMPAAEWLLNAASPAPERSFAKHQAS